MVTERAAGGDLFKAVSDPIRRQILELLRTGGRPVGEISERFPVSRPAISRHLRILREAGLVEERARGRERIYELRPRPLGALARWAGSLAAPASARRQEAPAPAAGAPARRRAAVAEGKERREAPAEGEVLDDDWRCW